MIDSNPISDGRNVHTVVCNRCQARGPGGALPEGQGEPADVRSLYESLRAEALDDGWAVRDLDLANIDQRTDYCPNCHERGRVLR